MNSSLLHFHANNLLASKSLSRQINPISIFEHESDKYGYLYGEGGGVELAILLYPLKKYTLKAKDKKKIPINSIFFLSK